jgi:glycosyltransferase involved in cell wall biosynthesis
MPKFTALLRTHNHAQHLPRVLHSLRPCDEVLVIDDASEDDTAKIARDHGAVFKLAIPGVSPGAYALDAEHDWILCLRPNESLSDDLEAALFEWKELVPQENTICYSVPIREAKGGAWLECPPEVRLIDRTRINWIGEMPPPQDDCVLLSGDLLSFQDPVERLHPRLGPIPGMRSVRSGTGIR